MSVLPKKKKYVLNDFSNNVQQGILYSAFVQWCVQHNKDIIIKSIRRNKHKLELKQNTLRKNNEFFKQSAHN